MRITDKFRRLHYLGECVCHLCEHTEISSNDTDHARTGLAQLKQRFLNNKTKSNNKMKIDKSLLRKGRWALEEEEYAAHIMQYLRSGLLTLPEGATSQSYLANKLRCDLTRITDKFNSSNYFGDRGSNKIECRCADISLNDMDNARTELAQIE